MRIRRIHVGVLKGSKLSNALNMYMLLQGRRLMKVQELAEILEVSPRTIKEYKKDLEMAGIYIESKRGRYGGYYLKDKINLKGLGINKEELESLKMARETISSGDYLFSTDFEILANKILNSQKNFEYVDYFGKDTPRPISMKQKEEEMWKLVSRSIINKKKIKITYTSLKQNIEDRKPKTRIVHPYGTFEYENATYFFGYCEMRKDIRYFKISRVDSIEVLQDKFAINIQYDIKNILRKSTYEG